MRLRIRGAYIIQVFLDSQNIFSITSHYKCCLVVFHEGI